MKYPAAFSTGIHKAAELDDHRLIMGGGLLAGLPVAMGIQALAAHRLNKTLKETKKITRPKQTIPQIYKEVGIDPRMPTVKVKNLDNAFYANPGEQSAELHKPEIRKMLRDKKMRERFNRQGLIAYDPEFATPGILAHEAGHAEMRTEKPWYHPSRINQSVLRPVGAALSAPAGLLAGLALSREGILPAAGGALAASSLLAAPTLINEWQASNRARNYISDSNLPIEQRAKNRRGLRRAWLTYLTGMTALPALAGAGMGFINSEGRLMPK
jgi:hypothetical protein